MQPFTSLCGVAAALPIPNIDTDMILPAEFLKTVSRTGLRRGLFHRLRYNADGAERADFVLNRKPWCNAQILVAHDNFGCGSSREHAPWALLDFGVRCIIAPSFAEIFAQNCTKNGILIVRLDPAAIESLIADVTVAENAQLTVDLERCTVSRRTGCPFSFRIATATRARLLAGSDDIVTSLERSAEILAHEQTMERNRPWVAGISLP